MRRLVQVIENDTGGSQTNDSDVITLYTYDALGNRLSVINARQFTSTHTAYDELYRPVLVVDALGNKTRIAYNALGLQTVITDANDAVTRYEYDGLNRPVTVTYQTDNRVVYNSYDALGHRLTMSDGLGLTTYEYDTLYHLTTVTDIFSKTVGYDYDLAGNRTQLVYPDGRTVTYTYTAGNRLEQVIDWQDNTTTYEYDVIGQLITTTLPNGVMTIQDYDGNGRLLNLRYTDATETLLAEFSYILDNIGNRTTVTETLYYPGSVEVIEAYLEENGQLVLEAENGAVAAGESHNWLLQSTQGGYTGTGYLRAMPDLGVRYETSETAESPSLSFVIQNNAPTTYTVWVRGMASDAGSDSLHLGLNGQAVDTTADLTGFGRDWGWTDLTMNDVPATLPLTMTGLYTLNLWMREDGLRIDRLLLVTDTNYLPTGVGPASDVIQTITNTTSPQLNSHIISYTYDPLYRLTGAIYTGSITATYSYAYDPVGNMTAYTETRSTGSGQAVGAETTRVNRTFDATNRLQTSFDFDQGTTSYLYDNNGNLTLVIPPNDGSWQHYTFDQRNLMTSHSLSEGGVNPELQAAYTYDGANSRMQQVDYTSGVPITTTYTNDIKGLVQVLVADDGTIQVYNLLGLDLISQDDGTDIRYLLTDGLGSVRTEMVNDAITSITVYDPYGNLLASTGVSGTSYGYTGEQFDDATGLLYLRARYYSPSLKQFSSRDKWMGNMKQPQTMNGWNYVNANPINLTDASGLQPSIDCNRWPIYGVAWIEISLQDLCNQASGPDNDPEVLDARELIYRLIVWGGRIKSILPESGSFGAAATMLDHYLDGNGSPKSIQFGANSSFVNDPGITRATRVFREPAIPGDEPDIIIPLLHSFLNNYVKPQVLCSTSSINVIGPNYLNGKDHYFKTGLIQHPSYGGEEIGHEPRPYDTGYFFAFGHVIIDGEFTAQSVSLSSHYIIEYVANYKIQDIYQWFPGKKGPLPFPGTDPNNPPEIPHEWAISLANASPPRAHNFEYTISWTERKNLAVLPDLSGFIELGS
jgi:RHS repeat-associated protein